jgi:tRNA dimethylallyltransferase
MKKLIVIAGPTASGKTAIAVNLAKELNTEIISADSRQFYKELSIGTAKPTKEEMDGVTHHFIDSHSIQEPLTAGKYEKEALSLLGELFLKHNTLICVGGSGMFIKALTEGTHQFPHSPALQAKLNNELREKGIEKLLERLEKIDNESYNSVDKENPARVIRALEICLHTGKKLSELKKNQKTKRDFSSTYIVLDHPRETLYHRINSRVDTMMDNGLLQEAKSVIQYKNQQTLNTVGYKELFDYLEGKLSLTDAVELIKRNTRRYAKRQTTWLRGLEHANWMSPPFEINEINEIMSIVKE